MLKYLLAVDSWQFNGSKMRKNKCNMNCSLFAILVLLFVNGMIIQARVIHRPMQNRDTNGRLKANSYANSNQDAETGITGYREKVWKQETGLRNSEEDNDKAVFYQNYLKPRTKIARNADKRGKLFYNGKYRLHVMSPVKKRKMNIGRRKSSNSFRQYVDERLEPKRKENQNQWSSRYKNYKDGGRSSLVGFSASQKKISKSSPAPITMLAHNQEQRNRQKLHKGRRVK